MLENDRSNSDDPREAGIVCQDDAGRACRAGRDPDVIRRQWTAGRSEIRDKLSVLARRFIVDRDALNHRVRQEVSQVG